MSKKVAYGASGCGVQILGRLTEVARGLRELQVKHHWVLCLTVWVCSVQMVSWVVFSTFSPSTSLGPLPLPDLGPPWVDSVSVRAHAHLHSKQAAEHIAHLAARDT